MLERKMIDDPDFIAKKLDPQMRLIMECAYRSVHHHYVHFKRYGCFALLGVDFLVDANYKVRSPVFQRGPSPSSDSSSLIPLFETGLAIGVYKDASRTLHTREG
jgi:hypothetical protein